MITIVKIILIVLLVLFIWLFIKWSVINPWIIKKMFQELSVTITGKRGSGKDTLMSWASYKKNHNSNVLLHDNTNIINLHELVIPGLTRESLVNGTFEKIPMDKFKKFEEITFISDAGIYFPSYDDSKLKKDYPELAITYAIWRHLYNAPLHFNVQNYERLWKVLREQVEDTLMTLGCDWNLPFFVLINVRYYESPRDCIEQKKPIKHHLFHRNDFAEVEESQRFIIKEYKLLLPKCRIGHDSRYFKKLIFKEEQDESQTLQS